MPAAAVAAAWIWKKSKTSFPSFAKSFPQLQATSQLAVSVGVSFVAFAKFVAHLALLVNITRFTRYAPFTIDLDIIPFCSDTLQCRCTNTIHVDLVKANAKKYSVCKNSTRAREKKTPTKLKWMRYFLLIYVHSEIVIRIVAFARYFSPHYFGIASNGILIVFFISVGFVTVRESRRTLVLHTKLANVCQTVFSTQCQFVYKQS